MFLIKKEDFDAMVRCIAKQSKWEAVQFVGKVLNYTLPNAKAYVELLLEEEEWKTTANYWQSRKNVVYLQERKHFVRSESN